MGTVRPAFGTNTTPRGEQTTESVYGDIRLVPERFREIVRLRYYVIQPLTEMPKGQRRKKDVEQRLAQVREEFSGELSALPRSCSTVYKWLRDFELSGRDIRSLAPSYGRRSGRSTAPRKSDLEKTIDEVIDQQFSVADRPSIRHLSTLVHARLRQENASPGNAGIVVPQPNALYMQIYRRLAKRESQAIMHSRSGGRVAALNFEPGNRRSSVERVLERVHADHFQLDVIAVDDEDGVPRGRPTLTYLQDEKSGYPCGIYVGFEPPSYLTVLQALRHAVMPKSDIRATYPAVKNDWVAYGVPETLVVNTGHEFTSKLLEDACMKLNIELVRSQVTTSHIKGSIERLFCTLNKELQIDLQLTPLPSVLDRGAYKPLESAVISYSALMEMLHVFLLDYYAQRPAKDGLAPAQAWSEGVYLRQSSISCEELTTLIGRVEERIVQKQGVEFQGLLYNSDELEGLRLLLNDQRVQVKYDPADLSRVWVYDAKRTHKWLEVPCTDQVYSQNLTLWKHSVISRYARQVLGKAGYDGLAEAKAVIRELVERECNRTSKFIH